MTVENHFFDDSFIKPVLKTHVTSYVVTLEVNKVACVYDVNRMANFLVAIYFIKDNDDDKILA